MHRLVASVLALAIAAAAMGLSVAQWRSIAADTTVLTARIGPTSLNGRILGVERFPDAMRLTMERVTIGGLARHKTPRKVRVRVRRVDPAIRPGDWVRLRAILSPPPPPAAPGAFDFQRHTYFLGLGGVGFALGKVTVTAPRAETGAPSPALAIAALRTATTARITAALPGTTGGVAAALMTGERSAVPAPVLEAIRDSGLAHLLAISGLHIGLVAGILFVAVRAGLALVPRLALGHPIKKWAAVAAIVGAFSYGLLAGATLPTQRAFLMIGLVLLGVLLDRRGISLRSVAWAAMIILAVQPESLVSASFQMSFAAVVALIAGYEYLSDRRLYGAGRTGDGGPTGLRVVARYLGGIAITTLIAGAATAPFALYHFNQFADYGVIANLAAVPVTALWVMPWAVAGFLLMPMGWEAAALTPMGWGIEAVIAIARTVAAWPGAVTLMPAMPTFGLVMIVMGGLWLCLWRRSWRLWGTAGMAAGVLTLYLAEPPDILIDGQGRIMAIRAADGTMMVSSHRGARFQREVWARLSGEEQGPGLLPATGRHMAGRLNCDIEGCLYRRGTLTAALIRRESAFAEDCWAAVIIVSLIPLRRKCPAARVIDRFDLWRHGSHAVWLRGGKIRVKTVDGTRGERPWVVKREGASGRRRKGGS